MSELDRHVAAWRTALARQDHDAVSELAAGVDDDTLEAVLAALTQHEHARPAEATVELDVERLHSALRRAGFDAAEALRLSQLAGKDPAAYLRACMLVSGTTSAHLTERVLSDIAALGEQDRPAVRRYIGRVLDGRHDMRRIRDDGLDALARASGAATALLRTLADSWQLPASGAAAAAARGGDSQVSPMEHRGQSTGAVDDLFLGREPEN